MKKNLLALIAVCIFTLAVILVINDVSNKKDQQVDSQYYVVDE